MSENAQTAIASAGTKNNVKKGNIKSMKYDTINNPKMIRLERLLNIKRWGAVGIIESLLQWTGEYAEKGNIGKWTNYAIAEGVHWNGDCDHLIAALVKSGWIKKDKSQRLLFTDYKNY